MIETDVINLVASSDAERAARDRARRAARRDVRDARIRAEVERVEAAVRALRATLDEEMASSRWGGEEDASQRDSD